MKLPRLLRRSSGAEVDRLYRRYSGEVLRYSSTVLRSRADAEDIVQTVFVRAMRAIERGEKVEKPRNWLIKIAHNECRRLLAARKQHAELPDEIPFEPADGGRAEELRGALQALPTHQRQALVLRELEGRSYAEIAASLSLSVSAVETLLFRARRALREQLEGALGCDEFALMLDDPEADRARLRAHARVCASCAHLERQARGRKGALSRIASTLFPWWGTGSKVAAVALTTATVAAVGGGVAVADRPHFVKPSPIVGGPTATGLATVNFPKLTLSHPRPVVAKPARRVVPAAPSGGAETTAAAPGLRLPVHHAATQPQPVPPGDDPLPVPEPTQPDPPPVPAPPTHVAPVAPLVTASKPAVTLPSVTLSAPSGTLSAPSVTVTTPSVTLPSATVTLPAVVPSVSTPAVSTPAVSVPTVTITTPSAAVPTQLPLPNVSAP